MRLQAFVNCFDEQCRRTGLDAEVIVVEWNPPPERRSVGSVLRLPFPSFCTYRFIDVPPEVHQRLRYADVVPLFETLAKNVGIRRARGRFVLATNIDIIFSTELIDFIASRQLEPGCLYRVDRHDIQSHFPVDAQLEGQMEFCASHQVRIHTRLGSEAVEPSRRSIAPPEGISDGRTVRLGAGWHARESSAGSRPYLWGGDRAEIILDLSAAGIPDAAVVDLEVESNPYGEVELLAFEDDRPLLQTRVAGRMRVGVRLPGTAGAGQRRIELRATSEGAMGDAPAIERSDALHYRLTSARVRSASDSQRFAYPPAGWAKANPDTSVTLSRTADGLLVTTDPRRWSYCVKYGPLRASVNGIQTFELVHEPVDGRITIGALSGDQTTWLPSSVRLHQGARLRQTEIAVDLRRGQPFWLVISNDHPGGEGVSRFVIERLEGSGQAGIALVPNRRETQVERVLRKLREHRPRWRWRAPIAALVNRVTGGLATSIKERVRARIVRVTELKSLKQALRALDLDEPPPILARNRDLRPFDTFLRDRRPGRLHVTTCGDFQLMAREDWNTLRAYPEIETFSMNIVGLFACIADAAGIREQPLGMPIYHIEHKAPSGPRPGTEALLRQRIAALRITRVDLIAVSIVATYARWLRRPVMFNAAAWGLAGEALTERTVARQVLTR